MPKKKDVVKLFEEPVKSDVKVPVVSEKERLLVLYQTLKDLVNQVLNIEQAIQQLNIAGFKTDYIAIRRQSDLQEPTAHDKQLIALAAAFLGKTRLIDNIAFEVS